MGNNRTLATVIDEAIAHRPLPLVIGVTGHRDLRDQDIDKLKGMVRGVFTELRSQYPHTPLLVISALAEGADRLAAEVALEFEAELICPLPLRKELYMKDFSDAASVAEFDAFLNKANYWFELPIMEGYTEEDLLEYGAPRDQHYAQVGAYIALRSQILLAMWNGEQINLVGGTSQVVHFKLNGVGAPYARSHSALDIIDSGPVYHIVTPRRSQFSIPPDAFELKKHYPEAVEAAEHTSSEFAVVYSHIDEFNRDTIEQQDRLAEKRHQSKGYLLNQDQQKRLSPKGMAMLDLYAVSDSMSVDFQVSTLKTLKVLLASVFFAAAFFHVYTHLYYKTPLFLIAYLAVFGIAYAWHFVASKKKLQGKYLDYRALAEGLRIQFFWQVAGFHDSVAFYYLRKQKSSIDWVRHAIRSSLMSVLALQHPNPARAQKHYDDLQFFGADDEESLEVVQKHWILDQAKYFKKAAHREHHHLHKFERWIDGALILGFILSVVQLVFAPNHILWVLIGLAAVAAGMLHTYTDKRAFNQHSKQYERMGELFKRASLHLQQLIDAGKLHDAREFVGEVGREALIENGDWIHTHRDRPIEVPKGA